MHRVDRLQPIAKSCCHIVIRDASLSLYLKGVVSFDQLLFAALLLAVLLIIAARSTTSITREYNFILYVYSLARHQSLRYAISARFGLACQDQELLFLLLEQLLGVWNAPDLVSVFPRRCCISICCEA